MIKIKYLFSVLIVLLLCACSGKEGAKTISIEERLVGKYRYKLVYKTEDEFMRNMMAAFNANATTVEFFGDGTGENISVAGDVKKLAWSLEGDTLELKIGQEAPFRGYIALVDDSTMKHGVDTLHYLLTRIPEPQ